MPRWTGDRYEIEELGARPLKGERPIVAFVGSIGDMLAVQLVEQNAKVVGT